MNDAPGSDARTIKSVDQAFAVIDYVEKTDGTTLSAVANELDMPVSTAHIHLSTLVENGYLLKVSGEYCCSFKFLCKGGRMRDGMALFQIAKPELDGLQQETSEHTNLMVEENGYAVQLYKSQGTETIDDDAPVGKYFHPHTIATGKAMLAERSNDEIRKQVEIRGLPASTEETITSEDTLFNELRTIRERGFSINREEHYLGVYAVGVVVESEAGEPIGAISVSGPQGRMSDERIDAEIAPSLLTKKNIIELKLRQQR